MKTDKMGIIKNKIDESFESFEKHKNYIILITDLLEQNIYKFGWQLDTFNGYVKEKLGELKNEGK